MSGEESIKERPELQAHQKWLDNSRLKHDIKDRSINSGINTIMGQATTFLLNFGSTIILARLLQPSDFGLIMMVTAFTGFLTIFKDLGLSPAIIQAKEVSQQQVSTIFWLNTAISIGIALLIAASAPFLAGFYKEPKLQAITFAYAGSFIIAGISQQHNALLGRQMMFGTIAKNNILSVLISVALGIGAAIAGLGYWSIVIQQVSLPVIQTITLWMVCNWRPDFYWNLKEANPLIRFGAGVSGVAFINYFSRNIDNILIGKFLGKSILGVYSKAYQLLMLPITQLRDPLNTVGIPALSSLQGDAPRFRQYYRYYVFILAFFSMPITCFLSVFSHEMITVVLGPGWEYASTIFRYLAITAFIQPLMSTASILLLATGRSRRFLVLGVTNSLVVILGFFIGIRWGIAGLTFAYALVHYLSLYPYLSYSFKGTPVKVGDFFAEVLPVAITTGLAGLVSWGLAARFSVQLQTHPIAGLIAGGIIFGLVYLVSWACTGGGRKKLAFIQNTVGNTFIKKIVKKKS